jgi:hypothetical protein
MGRPSDFTPELAGKICERLQDGRTLRDVCRDEDMPDERTVRGWATEDREGFFPQYARAREIGYQAMADELLEIADDGKNDWMERKGEDGNSAYVLNGEHVQRSRLRTDTRKWLLSKALPKIYGDRVVNEHSGPNGGPIAITQIQRVIVDPNPADQNGEGVQAAAGAGEV